VGSAGKNEIKAGRAVILGRMGHFDLPSPIPSAGIKVVLDTPVALAGLAYPASYPGYLIEAWRKGALNWITGLAQLSEIEWVVGRICGRRLAGPSPEMLSGLLRLFTTAVEPGPVFDPQTRTPWDAMLVSLHLEGAARRIVTSSTSLLALADRYPVVTPRTLWHELHDDQC